MASGKPTNLEHAWKRRGGPLGRFVEGLDKQGVPYLSHSKLASLERCPRCYHRRYILGSEAEETKAMEVGNLFHTAARRFYAGLREGCTPAPAALLTSRDLRTIPAELRPGLRNAVHLLRGHHWAGHEVVSIEVPFFLDLAPELPPVIGIPDLVLRRHNSLVLVDHKTSRTFKDCDPAQLVLYAEHLRREHGHPRIVGVFDEYRLVDDLHTIRKPAFRRTPVCVDPSLLGGLVRRYRTAWRQIARMTADQEPRASPDCWTCSQRQGW